MDEGICGNCIADPPAFDATIVAFRYAFPLDKLIQALKFSARLDLATRLAMPLATAMAPWRQSFDLLLAVPLSRQRLGRRGFDQGEMIARAVAGQLDIAHRFEALVKTRDTSPQSGLDRKGRVKNVRGAYACTTALTGLSIALVDDVMTTGATLCEAAGVMKRAGAARVTACVLARAGEPGTSQTARY
jgi:ComF family protein